MNAACRALQAQVARERQRHGEWAELQNRQQGEAVVRDQQELDRRQQQIDRLQADVKRLTDLLTKVNAK